LCRAIAFDLLSTFIFNWNNAFCECIRMCFSVFEWIFEINSKNVQDVFKRDVFNSLVYSPVFINRFTTQSKIIEYLWVINILYLMKQCDKVFLYLCYTCCATFVSKSGMWNWHTNIWSLNFYFNNNFIFNFKKQYCSISIND